MTAALDHRPGRGTAWRPRVVAVALVIVALGAAAVVLLTPPGSGHSTRDLGLYLTMWTAMVTAMMLPSAAPMVVAVLRLARDARQAVLLPVALSIGYLAVWSSAGLGAYVLQAALGPAVALHHRPDGGATSWPSGAVLIAAGLFALSPLAERCLTACRRPAGFVAARWPGRGPMRTAVRIGLDYGSSCLACCAALMTALVVVGTAGVLPMAAFGVVMAVQKNSRHGIWVSRCTACLLLLVGTAIAVQP